MRISTAEIKILIRECVNSEGVFTNVDFARYISQKTSKEFTRSQISGAITQLVDCGDLKRIERGLFVGRDKKVSDKTGQDQNDKSSRLIQSIVDWIDITEKNFDKMVGSTNVWNLTEQEFEISNEVRAYRETLGKMKKKCERVI